MVVVTGHQDDRVAAALVGLAVTIADNPDYGSGLASSLKTGVRALPADADGALVMLGDMPDVAAADLDRLIAAFVASGGTAIVRATHDGRRGNPVILPRALFPDVAQLEGDTGARHIVEAGETIRWSTSRSAQPPPSMSTRRRRFGSPAACWRTSTRWPAS